jgi:hypothetical protein
VLYGRATKAFLQRTRSLQLFAVHWDGPLNQRFTDWASWIPDYSAFDPDVRDAVAVATVFDASHSTPHLPGNDSTRPGGLALHGRSLCAVGTICSSEPVSYPSPELTIETQMLRNIEAYMDIVQGFSAGTLADNCAWISFGVTGFAETARMTSYEALQLADRLADIFEAVQHTDPICKPCTIMTVVYMLPDFSLWNDLHPDRSIAWEELDCLAPVLLHTIPDVSAKFAPRKTDTYLSGLVPRQVRCDDRVFILAGSTIP